MSNDADAFIEKIALDESLRKTVTSSNRQEILQIASDMGFSFDPAEFNAALESALGASEITDDQLEAVAGGAIARPRMSRVVIEEMLHLRLDGSSKDPAY